MRPVSTHTVARCGQFGGGFDTQLVLDVLEVGFDCLDAPAQRSGDLTRRSGPGRSAGTPAIRGRSSASAGARRFRAFARRRIARRGAAGAHRSCKISPASTRRMAPSTVSSSCCLVT